ncbi:ComEC/Rec2 family competence protein [Clostridium lundense]|uniref:ComEC/Rec2 family competence protein n=1 Tax=Clostridium lundense TaxID=319475 RepID=UPI000A0184E8|nr:MBL fold metallo-hydrolase [Clostridium lundense]
MKKLKKIFIVMICILIFTSKVYANEKYEVHFLDTGQSDCILIKGNNLNILIDTGTELTSHKVIRYLNKERISKINYLIITHYHDDHYGGLEKILKAKKVEKLYIPAHADPMRDIIYKYAYLSCAQVKYIAENFSITKDGININGIVADEYQRNIENNNSIVLLGKVNNNKYLFSADIENEREKEVINKYKSEINNCDVLKIPHHGLNTSCSEEFLNVVNPKISIITCNGKESPQKEVLDRLKKINTTILRTDLNGNIVIK